MNGSQQNQPAANLRQKSTASEPWTAALPVLFTHHCYMRRFVHQANHALFTIELAPKKDCEKVDNVCGTCYNANADGLPGKPGRKIIGRGILIPGYCYSRR
jgi:hypothetical protein